MAIDTQIATGPVEIPRPGKAPLAAYLARPDGAQPAPGVVVIHEIFGLNDNIREIARRFAHEGYAALAVDLFAPGNRALCLLRVMAGLMLRPLHNAGIDALRTSVRWLQAQEQVDRARIGVIGFCMGGGYALALACVDEELRAASVFYGQAPRPLSALRRACPIAGSYPGRDPMTRGVAPKLEETLTRYGIPHEIKLYPQAAHSFFNDTSRNYNAEAAADAWARTLAFFTHYLGREGGAQPEV
jgi:carboxymethylenebutenolidase